MKYIIQFVNLFTAICIVTANFGYSKRDQHIWNQKYKSCGGKLQSPISISTSKSVVAPLPSLEIVGYHNFLPGPLVLNNNGHSVVLGIDTNSSKQYSPYIFGAALKMHQEYEMDHLHFHWGGKNNRGSEHILNGVRFPMEMHIVHRNRAYSNLSDALNHPDGLAVLGIFFQEEDNEHLYSIINALVNVQLLNEKVKLNMSVTLSSLMPQNTDVFYTYKGSLTTPPCNEVVTWIIFSSPVPISFRQINKFRTLSTGEDILADNYRKLQDIGLRKVYVRRMRPGFATKFNSTFFNVTSMSWFWQ